jgi:putative FmdB family regulatory protein
MPFYEYRCRECGESFEVLRPVAERDKPAECPRCGASEAERKLTLFATAGSQGEGGTSRPSCEFSGGG